MKNNFSIVVWMMVVSVFVKMLVYFMNWQFTSYEMVAKFVNVFVLMSGVFFGIQLYKKGLAEKSEFLQDVKAGMRVAALYAVFMTAFVYLYYTSIDATYFDLKLENQISLALEANPDLNVKQIKETGQFVLSPFFQSTITLIGFIILGSFYASIITFLIRKFSFER